MTTTVRGLYWHGGPWRAAMISVVSATWLRVLSPLCAALTAVRAA